MLVSMALEVFCFWLMTFEPRELHGKTTHFVDLNEMHLPSKFHIDMRSLRDSEGQKAAILNLWILPKICSKFGTLIEQNMVYRMAF